MIRVLRITGLVLASFFALTSCGGGGGGTSLLGGSGSSGGGAPSGASGGKGNVQFTLTLAAPSSSGTTSSATRIVSASAVRKPMTISSSTESITVSVNGGSPQIFNTSSCSGSPNLTCVLSIGAAYGVDSFLILTWSGPNGTGTALNAAAVTLNVTQSGPNTASATAGTLLTVNSSGDGSGGTNSCAAGSTTCTLREAVAEASTTAGVFTAIMFSGVSSITVASPIAINNQNIVVIGPGATASNTAGVGAPSASGNLKISGGNSTQIFHITSGMLAIDGITLTNGVSQTTCTLPGGGECGGAIENYGTLSVVNTIFSANGSTSTTFGGAIYDESQINATTAIAYSTFTGNAAQEGGAYYITGYLPTGGGGVFTGCLFSNNTASDGSSYGSGGAIYAIWNLSVASSTFTANVAGSMTAGGFSGSGGAIYLGSASSTSQSPSITNSTFGGSSASAGNFAGGAGPTDYGDSGAIHNSGYSPLILSGNTFANNVARGGQDAYGGAIEDDTGITSTGDTFSNNLADASASTSSDGGYVGGGAIDTDANTSWTNDTFTANQAKAGTAANGSISSQAIGGAISSTEGDPAFLVMTGTTFSNNTASAASSCLGGAVYSDWDSSTVTLPMANVTFTGNSCNATNGNGTEPDALGGGLYVRFGLISFEGVTFTNNSATADYTTNDTNATAVAVGGGFAYEDGYFSCDCSFRRHRGSPDLTISAARATAAANQNAQRIAHMLALATKHANPSAKHAAQTVVHARAPLATRRVAQTAPTDGIDGSTFSGNTVTAIGLDGNALGGGLDLSGQAAITNTTISGNSATWSAGTQGFAAGGGVSMCARNGGQASVSATVTGNTASSAGGGIANFCSFALIQSSTISGNTVSTAPFPTDGGGGIFNCGYEPLIAGSTLNGNSVKGSTATTGGGGFTNIDEPAEILNSTIYNNTSSVDGGGIENASEAETDIENSTIYQNSASGNGGGINNDPYRSAPDTTFIYIANSIFAADTAANGSDIWNIDQLGSGGYNLVQQSANYGPGTSTAPQPSDIIGQSPLLASGLASNGGPTQTLADTSSSPGKGHIPFASSLCNGVAGTNVDQRGYSRGAGGVCDIGAYEFSGTPTTPQSLTTQNVRSIVNLHRNR